ncbi:response regulator transcription factor [Paenibacillus yanchengensis]|uniref:Response regulator transcription factor n=1 Tax=Paenibacillus yanchengensis TaxID=2035833 RepID=A0ABW4YFC4_9BACL
MRILLLEDEESIRGFVRINLRRNQMEVIEAETGEAALMLAAQEGPFDIALLDVMLPTISGFEVCEQLRALYPQMGIIMLTAKSQEEDKIYGLELGADDYIQKPFSPGELIARIKSLKRRLAPVQTNNDMEQLQTPTNGSTTNNKLVLDSGIFRLSLLEHRFWKREQEIILTPTEWMLVKLLLERAEENVSRDFILTEIWGKYYTGDLKVVDVNIRRLRQKIEDDPSEPMIIETIWGYGYRWRRRERR